MKIGILTSSRADFGIYEPLLNELILEKDFEVEIIAFGTHLSNYHGFTLSDILKKYTLKIHQINSLLVNDNAESIASSYGLTVLKFAEFWASHTYDLVCCLGDRYEMNAAVQSGVPQGVPFAHIHGGETTLGATDNIYRHQITLASYIHFTSTETYKNRVIQLLESNVHVYNVGALSVSNLEDFTPISKDVLFSNFNMKDAPYCLITFHPETIAFDKNNSYAKEMKKALVAVSKNINLVITMPNADTMGSVYREQLEILKKECSEHVVLIENFGKQNYFSAMYYATFMLGNTSSGIIEAASFNTYVVNVGDRQKGRAQSANIIDVKFESNAIVKAAEQCLSLGAYQGRNIYFKQNSAKEIVKKIKAL